MKQVTFTLFLQKMQTHNAPGGYSRIPRLLLTEVKHQTHEEVQTLDIIKMVLVSFSFCQFDFNVYGLVSTVASQRQGSGFDCQLHQAVGVKLCVVICPCVSPRDKLAT